MNTPTPSPSTPNLPPNDDLSFAHDGVPMSKAVSDARKLKLAGQHTSQSAPVQIAGSERSGIPADPSAMDPAQAALAVTKARKQHKPIKRAIAWAGFSGYSTLLFGILSALMGAMGGMSIAGIMVGLGLIGAGSLELSGRAKLRQLTPSAVAWLLSSQLVLCLTIVAYGGWKVYEVVVHGSVLTQELEEQLAGVQGAEAWSGLMDSMTFAVYVGVIAIGVAAPAWAAFIYWRKKKPLRTLTESNPAWVLEALKG